MPLVAQALLPVQHRQECLCHRVNQIKSVLGIAAGALLQSRIRQ